jgi:hypothetical protein
MQVQLRKGGAVHTSDDGAPNCDPWQSGNKFRTVQLEVTCKKCLTWLAKHAEAETPAEPETVTEPTAQDVAEELSAHWGDAYRGIVCTAAGVHFRSGRTTDYAQGMYDAAILTLMARGCSHAEAESQVLDDAKRYREALKADKQRG